MHSPAIDIYTYLLCALSSSSTLQVQQRQAPHFLPVLALSQGKGIKLEAAWFFF